MTIKFIDNINGKKFALLDGGEIIKESQIFGLFGDPPNPKYELIRRAFIDLRKTGYGYDYDLRDGSMAEHQVNGEWVAFPHQIYSDGGYKNLVNALKKHGIDVKQISVKPEMGEFDHSF